MKLRPLCHAGQLATAIAALFATHTVQADSSSWNVGTAGGWATASNWVGSSVPGATSGTSSPDVATFGFTLTGTRTVTVDANRNIGGIIFSNTAGASKGYILSSNTLLLSDGGFIQTATGNGAHTDTIASGVEIQGDNGSASFMADATSALSRVKISGAVTGTAATGTTTTLTLNGSNIGQNEVAGAISDSTLGGILSLTKNGTGYWTLSSDNAYTGATLITGGQLVITAAGALGDVAGGTTVESGATLLLYNGGLEIGEGTINLSGVGLSSAGALQNNGDGNSLTGNVVLKADTRINSLYGDLTLTTAGSVTGAYNLTVGGVAQTRIDSVIGTAGGGLTKDGEGTLTLTNSNTYTGVTNVVAGVLNARSDTALGTTAGGVVVTSGAALQLQGGISIGNEALTVGGSGIADDGALRNVSGDNSYAGAVTLTAATRINSDLGTLTLPSTAAISGSYPLTVGGDSNTKIESVIGTGSGTLTKDGAGVLTLTGSNTYTGGTTITAGTLQLGDGGTTGKLSTTSTIINDGILKLDRSNGIVQGTDFKGGISGTGSVTITGGTGGTGITTLDGGNTYQGGTTVSGGTLNLTHTTSGSATGTGLVTIASGATLTGTGVIGGSLTVDGTHSPGNSPGVTSVGGDVTYNAASIFTWELTANTTTQGTAPAYTYDQVLMTGTNKTLTIDPNAKIRLIFDLGSVNFANTGFWNTTQTWNIISGYTSFSGNFIIDSIGLDSLGQNSTNYPIGYPAGVFSMSGGTLTWSAVPEPTGVVAGLLLGAGLLRRRR